VVAVDRDRASLTVAARRVECPMVVGDVHALPFVDAAFDAMFAVTVCELTADPAVTPWNGARFLDRAALEQIGRRHGTTTWQEARIPLEGRCSMDSADVKAFFDRVSGEWDDMRESFYNEQVIRCLAAAVDADAAMVVLDVGTGTGFVAAGLASDVGRVIGVDHSEAMLRVAHDNFARLGIDNVETMIGNLDRLPLDDRTVDATVANMVLHHAPDPLGMLTEMVRVTRAGGWVAITDEVAHHYEWMHTEQADIWLGFTPAEVEGFFAAAGLTGYHYESLGIQ
jgi:ubiquinone/menaquinone biosynthesis C-methylase UbiE